MDLSTLTPELQAMIIGSYPSHKHNLQLISKGIKNVSIKQHLIHACTIPIHPDEVHNYQVEYLPACIHAFMSRDYDFDSSMIYAPEYDMLEIRMCSNKSGMYINGRELIEYIATEIHKELFTEDLLYPRSTLYKAPIYRYDLITTWYVMKERISCTNVFPGFAKKVAVDTLIHIHAEYEKYKAHSEDIIFNHFVYLSINAFMMNINISTNLAPIPMQANAMTKAVEYCEKMIQLYYPLILRYLVHIDDTSIDCYMESFVLADTVPPEESVEESSEETAEESREESSEESVEESREESREESSEESVEESSEESVEESVEETVRSV